MSAEKIAQAESQASELFAKLPQESPLLQAVEAMAKQHPQLQLELMQQQQQQQQPTTPQQNTTTSQYDSNFNPQSQSQSQRWLQQQQQQQQQHQQQQQQQQHHLQQQSKEQYEMLFNSFYKTGTLPAGYAQNPYGLTPDQMKQFYNSELLNYYQQQQQYNQFFQVTIYVLFKHIFFE